MEWGSCIVAMLFMNSTVESSASDLKYVPDQSIKENWDGAYGDTQWPLLRP